MHHTIVTTSMFRPGTKVAIGASGGKDSTVLAHVLKLLNARHGYGLDLNLLSIDEGITGAVLARERVHPLRFRYGIRPCSVLLKVALVQFFPAYISLT